jgi:insertion element IS1 protein InsB
LKNGEQFLVIDSVMNNQEISPQTDNLTCSRCRLSHIKKNGRTYYGKQNYRCKSCGRQFVFRDQILADAVKQLICRLLLEKISLRGICRVLDVSLCWLLNFMRQIYKMVPADLNFRMPEDSEFEILCLEADEMWSFVRQKTNKQWIWLVLERRSGQVAAVHIGDTSQRSAVALWQKLPPEVKANALILTDCWEASALAIPAESSIQLAANEAGRHLLSKAFIAVFGNEFRVWCERQHLFQRTRKIILEQSIIFCHTAIWKDKNYILLLEHYF